MVSASIFKAYDVRGIYPNDINPRSIALIGKALTHMWKSGIVVIARDGRHGSENLSLAMQASVALHGPTIGRTFTIVDVGLTTTPMFYFLVNNLKAVGGVMITASHDPKEYNGVKAVLPGAEPISGIDILKLIEEKGYDL